MIRAGKVSEISWSTGEWLLLDIGFSGVSKSCGLVLNDGLPERVLFADAVKRVVEFANRNGILNLVIEAPLSVTFDKDGNPKARTIERQDNQTRFWYCGAGPAVLIAATYLLKEVINSNPKNQIRLFEGFVSYNKRTNKSNHGEVVELLREVIKHPDKFKSCIHKPESLKTCSSDRIASAFQVAEMDIGVPPVIKRDYSDEISN